MQPSSDNPSNELDGQRFGVENISTENDPSGCVGWLLIAMDCNVICNIDRNKSDIRNMKNQILKFPSAGATFQSPGTEKNNTFTQSKNRSVAFDIWKHSALPKIGVAH